MIEISDGINKIEEDFLVKKGELKEQIKVEKKKAIPMMISEYLANQPRTKEIDSIRKIEINREEIEATIEKYKPKKDSMHVDSLCFGGSPLEITRNIIHRTKHEKFIKIHGLETDGPEVDRTEKDGLIVRRPIKGWGKCIFCNDTHHDEFIIDLLDANDECIKSVNDIPIDEVIVKKENRKIKFVKDPKTGATYKPAKFGTKFYRPSGKIYEHMIDELKSEYKNKR